MFKQNAVILFQGDSITDAGRSYEPGAPNQALGEGYAMLAASRLLADYPARNFSIWNRGISGNKVNQLADRWEADCLQLKPDVLSIMIGVNDCVHSFREPGQLAVPEYEGIYRNLLKRTRERLPDVKLILCEPFLLPTGDNYGTPELRADIVARCNAVKRLANENGAVLVPFQDMFNQALEAAPAAYWAADAVHPGYGGHLLMAREWLKCAAAA